MSNKVKDKLDYFLAGRRCGKTRLNEAIVTEPIIMAMLEAMRTQLHSQELLDTRPQLVLSAGTLRSLEVEIPLGIPDDALLVGICIADMIEHANKLLEEKQ